MENFILLKSIIFFLGRFGIKPDICQKSPRKTPSEDLTEEEQEHFYTLNGTDPYIHQQLHVQDNEYVPEISVKQSAY